MKEGLKKIGNVLWTVLNSRVFYFLIMAAIFFFAFQKCKSEEDLIAEKTKLEQNISAKNDTIKYYKSKTGTLQAEKEIFIKTEKELKKENSDLYKRIQKQEGNIISLNRSVIKLTQEKEELNDTIEKLRKIIGEAVQVDSNTWMFPWRLEYEWDSTNYDIFEGETFVSVSNKSPIKLKHDDTKLTYRETQIDIEFGEKVVDGKYNVFINSEYPGFKPETLEGVFIDPNSNKDIKKLMKKDHWFTGYSIAISITPGYDVINQKPTIVVGPSLNYNIYQW